MVMVFALLLCVQACSAYLLQASAGAATSARAVAPSMTVFAPNKPAKSALPRSPLPRNARAGWEVHKFGGASLATAELYKQCSDLLIDESKRQLETIGSCVPTMAIVSAKGGVTDRLIAVIETAMDNLDESAELLRAVTSEQIDVVRTLAGDEIADAVELRIRQDEEDIINVVRAVSLLRTIPPSTMDLVTGYGEVWSAMTMHAYLQATGTPTAWLDAREVLIVEQTGAGGLGDKGSSNTVGTDPLWGATAQRVVDWFADEGRSDLSTVDCKTEAPVVVVTGFVASTEEGAPTTLKRSGSDYSATIFARLMGASRITMWKNVNGVYTADPRRVPEAFPIESLKYDEAIELAYFGAQVLHPSAMQPCIEGEIPIYVRNVFNPTHPGTVIEGRACTLSDSSSLWSAESTLAKKESRIAECPVEVKEGDSPIRGITSVDILRHRSKSGTDRGRNASQGARLKEEKRLRKREGN